MQDQLHFWPEDKPGAALRWSVSRDRRLSSCARRYYFFHFGSRGGAKAPAGSLARELYVLRSLRNRFMWVGEIVHELIEDAVRSARRRREVNSESLIERGVERMRERYRESQSQAYRRRPGLACGLIEHEYGEILTRGEWQAQRDRLQRCLTHFVSMPWLETLRSVPRGRFLGVETQSSFEFEGATIVVKPDVAWQPSRGKVAILDWKTGIRHDDGDDRFQLAVYALYGQQAWKLRQDETIDGHVVYLDSGQTDSFAIDSNELTSARARVRASVAAMRALEEQSSPEGPDPGRFPPTSDLSQCARCEFRRICGRP